MTTSSELTPRILESLVARKANSQQNQVIQRVLRSLRGGNDSQCSYRLHLPIYTSLKIQRHRKLVFQRRQLFEDGFDGYIPGIHYEIIQIEAAIARKAESLYENPCFQCDTCKERRSDWPMELIPMPETELRLKTNNRVKLLKGMN